MAFLSPHKVVGELRVRPGFSVADFGAGSGFFTHALSKLVGEEGKVYAIDIQGELLQEIKTSARKHGVDNIEIIKGDLEEERGSGLPDHSVNMVVISNTLFQTKDKAAVAKEIGRVLEKKGSAFVVEWQESFGGIGPAKEDVVEPDIVVSLLEKNDCEFIREIPVGPYHYGLLFRKVSYE